MKKKRVDLTETFKEYLKWYSKNAVTLELGEEYAFEYFRAWIAGFQDGYDKGFKYSYESSDSEGMRMVGLNAEEALCEHKKGD